MVSDRAIRVRHAAAGDAVGIGALVRSLSPDSIVRRFMGGVSRGFATEELCREVRGGGADFALVAENSSGEIVGEAYAAMLSAQEAEAAFVVRDRDQHHGVGTALLGGIIAELRARGIRTLHADTTYGNVAMLALLREFGFPLDERHLNGGVHVTLQIGASRPIETAPPPS
jgi:N-acetylglutamate synthase-like GNAT family acetyltransferase